MMEANSISEDHLKYTTSGVARAFPGGRSEDQIEEECKEHWGQMREI